MAGVRVLEDASLLAYSTSQDPSSGGSGGRPLVLDVLVPELNLAIEYHGPQHYYDLMLFGLSKTYQGNLNRTLLIFTVALTNLIS